MSELTAATVLERRRLLRVRVGELASELERADLKAAQLRVQFQDAVREAVRAGIPKAALAREAGLTRQRIGQIVG